MTTDNREHALEDLLYWAKLGQEHANRGKTIADLDAAVGTIRTKLDRIAELERVMGVMATGLNGLENILRLRGFYMEADRVKGAISEHTNLMEGDDNGTQR